MPRRCDCDSTPEAGPSTHHGAAHGDPFGNRKPACEHSELRKTTRRHKRKKYKPVPGTKRIVAVDSET